MDWLCMTTLARCNRVLPEDIRRYIYELIQPERSCHNCGCALLYLTTSVGLRPGDNWTHYCNNLFNEEGDVLCRATIPDDGKADYHVDGPTGIIESCTPVILFHKSSNTYFCNRVRKYRVSCKYYVTDCFYCRECYDMQRSLHKFFRRWERGNWKTISLS